MALAPIPGPALVEHTQDLGHFAHMSRLAATASADVVDPQLLRLRGKIAELEPRHLRGFQPVRERRQPGKPRRVIGTPKRNRLCRQVSVEGGTHLGNVGHHVVRVVHAIQPDDIGTGVVEPLSALPCRKAIIGDVRGPKRHRDHRRNRGLFLDTLQTKQRLAQTVEKLAYDKVDPGLCLYLLIKHLRDQII